MDKIKTGLSSIFTGRKLDDNMLEELENTLITADININIVNNITSFLVKNKFDKNITIDDVKKIIYTKINEVFDNVKDKKIELIEKPHVIMFSGVNGSGKTTVIGKIANRFKKQNKKILLAACDTFRAGAVEQLNEWKKRADVDIMMEEGADPASLAFKSYKIAKDENYDLLLIDTAGRLQNNANLMAELTKIQNVLKKIDQNLPHDSFIVLDATTGQNAIKQMELFSKAINIDGIILNKMDGTSKGGVLISIVDKFKKPIVAVGVGEKIDDLRDFDKKNFLDRILG